MAFWEFSLVRMPTDRAPQFTGKGQERACVVGVNPSPASVEPGGLVELGPSQGGSLRQGPESQGRTCQPGSALHRTHSAVHRSVGQMSRPRMAGFSDQGLRIRPK